MNRRVLGSVLFYAAAALACNAQAKSGEITIRFPVEYAADISQGLANQDFIERIEKASEGRIKVRFAPDGAMYKGNELAQAHLRGDAEMTTLVPAYWTSIANQVQLFDLPYAFPDYETFDRVASNKEFVAKVYSQVESKGLKVLGLLANSYALPGTREKQLVDAQDFKGLKMRAIGRVNAGTLKALGANAISINLVEVPAALQQGLVDGIQTLADAYVQYKFHDQIKQITDARYQLIYYPWTVNAKWFDSLDPADRKLIQTAVDEAIEANKPVTKRLVSEAMDELRAQGVNIVQLTPEQEKSWEDKTAIVWDEAEQSIGKDLIDDFRKVRNGR